jgi:hypothetical protein
VRGRRERGGEGGAAGRRGEHERLVDGCVSLSSWGPLYIVGRGAPCPLPKAPRAAARGREARAAEAKGGASRSPNPNPSLSPTG